MDEQMVNHGEWFSAQGYCPNCNHRIRIQLKVDFAGGRKKAIPQEIIDKVTALLPTKRPVDIAVELKVPYSTVCVIKKRSGIPLYNKYKKLCPEIDKVLSTMRNGDIAEKFRVPISFITGRRVETGIKTNRDIILSEKRDKIMRLHNEGFNDGEIGRIVRLSRQRIEQIIKGI